jgi:hypothetical protein
MYQKTQLDALATGSRIEGMRMASKEGMKIIIYALAVALVTITLGIIAWLLTQ